MPGSYSRLGRLEGRLAKEVIALTGSDRLEECLGILRKHRDLASLQTKHMDRIEQYRERIKARAGGA